jgi:hypothetical protein
MKNRQAEDPVESTEHLKLAGGPQRYPYSI